MKRRSLRIVVFIFLFGIAYFAYSRRFQIAATVWHWKHDGSVQVGNYVVPVPPTWLVERGDASVSLTNTSRQRQVEPGFYTNAGILLMLVPRPGDLDFWKSTEMERLKQQHIEPIEQKVFRSGSDVFVCLGGNELRTLGIATSKVISMSCKSSGRLEIIFTGPQSDLEAFYTIVSQIRRHDRSDSSSAGRHSTKMGLVIFF